MSRSKKDILDTERMLERLTALLAKHHPDWKPTDSPVMYGDVRRDAEALRRISLTLHRWHALECGDSNEYGAWAIVRGHKLKGSSAFTHDDDGAAFMGRREYRWTRGGTTGKRVNHSTTYYTAIPDREAGARKRLAQILKRYPSLTAYVQGDPRGCALYILTKADVPEGADVSSCYSRGLAVYQ